MGYEELPKNQKSHSTWISPRRFIIYALERITQPLVTFHSIYPWNHALESFQLAISCLTTERSKAENCLYLLYVSLGKLWELKRNHGSEEPRIGQSLNWEGMSYILGASLEGLGGRSFPFKTTKRTKPWRHIIIWSLSTDMMSMKSTGEVWIFLLVIFLENPSVCS